MISVPVAPFAGSAGTFDAELTFAFVAMEDGGALFVSEGATAVEQNEIWYGLVQISLKQVVRIFNEIF